MTPTTLKAGEKRDLKRVYHDEEAFTKWSESVRTGAEAKERRQKELLAKKKKFLSDAHLSRMKNEIFSASTKTILLRK